MNRLSHTLSLCLLPALLSACVGGMPLNADKEKLFAELNKNGPDVEGVEGTLLKGAKAMDARGEYDKSTGIYQQLVAIDNKNISYMESYASGLRRTGKLEAAGEAYDQLLKKDPKNLEAQEGKALVKLGSGEYEEAGKLLTDVYAQDKTRWRTINGLAILLVQRGMNTDAIAYFKEAAKQSKENVSVLNNLGLTYAINNQYRDATQTLKKAVDGSEPKTKLRRNVELNLALVYGINGDLDLAENILKNNMPPSGVDNNLGLYAYLANDESLAKSYLNTALSKSPYHYERAWENLATITEQSKGAAGKKVDAKSKVLKIN
jgi:Flp pilus assembly protein TadD